MSAAPCSVDPDRPSLSCDLTAFRLRLCGAGDGVTLGELQDRLAEWSAAVFSLESRLEELEGENRRLREAADGIRAQHKAKAIACNFDDCGCGTCELLRAALSGGGSKDGE